MNDLANAKELISAIHIIWQQIAYDCGEPDDNECAVELCVDAGRLEPVMGFLPDSSNAHLEFRGLVDAFGYHRTLQILAADSRLQLV
jgi:hypothetical protein